MKTIIVEDERNNADLLRHFLTKYCPTVELIDTCYTKHQAVISINQKTPELLFLDIILEEDTAFDLLDEIDYSQTHIIFITAFDQYALKAFQYNAVDYLLKPVQIDHYALQCFYSPWKTKGYQIVYVSIDENTEDFNSYYKNDPWETYQDKKDWEAQLIKSLRLKATPTLYCFNSNMELLKEAENAHQMYIWIESQLQ